MTELKIGMKHTLNIIVEPSHLAVNVGSGTLEVLATPAVASFMEQAAWQLLQPYLEEGITTVGTKISIEHISATPLNAEIQVSAKLTEIDGRKYTFELSAQDNAGIIAKGTHERFAVKSEKFMEKTLTKIK